MFKGSLTLGGEFWGVRVLGFFGLGVLVVWGFGGAGGGLGGFKGLGVEGFSF